VSVERKELEHIATLARLRLSEQRIPELTAQMNDILSHMDVLRSVPIPEALTTEGESERSTSLRSDENNSVPLAHSIETFAPLTRDGFFLVPRLDAHAAKDSAEK
jgi:aspartyl-tRNA(Asn)/glutamyl-tRNA(Gln) amidotransferase subunit C